MRLPAAELDYQSLKTHQSHLSWPLTVSLRLEGLGAPSGQKGNQGTPRPVPSSLRESELEGPSSSRRPP